LVANTSLPNKITLQDFLPYIISPSAVCTWAYVGLNINLVYTASWIDKVNYICTDINNNKTTTTSIINPSANDSSVLQPNQKSTDDVIQFNNQLIYNESIVNNKCYTKKENIPILDSKTVITTQEFKKALIFLYSYEMTMFQSIDSFAPYRTLSRQEAAKILSNFAMNVLCRKPNMNLQTSYSDTDTADLTLQSYITLAYQLDIMKWSGKWNGTFRPFEAITKAELNAVIIRMILKSYLNEDGEKRYTNYNTVSSLLGIITQSAWIESLSRNDATLMMFRAYRSQDFSLQNIWYDSFVLKNRNSFLWQ
jgi:hypothetical protein